MDPFQITVQNNNTRIKTWARYQQNEFIEYFNQQPVNTIAIFYKSFEKENHEEDYRNMLHRANQIVHLGECINIKDIKELLIHCTKWNLGNGVHFNMLWIQDREITLDTNQMRERLFKELYYQHQQMTAITFNEQHKIKPNEKSYFDRAIVSISYLQSDKRPTSSSSPFDDPLPDEEHGESIRESSNIEHGEASNYEAFSHLSNQNDNLVSEVQNVMQANQEVEELKDQH